MGDEQVDLSFVVKRISKLLAMAADAGASQTERESASQHVAALLERYQLTLDHVQAQQVDRLVKDVEKVQAQCLWLLRLAGVVGEFVGTVAMFCSSRGHGRTLIWAGRASQVRLASSLWWSLQMHLRAEATVRYGSFRVGRGKDYCEGFVAGAAETVRQSRTHRSSVGQQIVVRAKQEADAFAQQAFAEDGQIVRGQRKLELDVPSDFDRKAAFASGFRSGRAVSLSKAAPIESDNTPTRRARPKALPPAAAVPDATAPNA
jgi:hypothetical protein